jgi:Tfp pilus assembly major pilin PilA
MNADLSDSMEALYRAAVGPTKSDFYVPKFIRFDQSGASKVSWNWSAFLVSFYWFLYRRMYGYWAIYCLLIPMALAIAGGIVGAIGGSELGSSLYSLATLGYSVVLIPMYANALYHRAIKQRIETLRQKVHDPATRLAVLENGPHTSHVIWIVLAFFVIVVIALLAAIAIPGYQAYAIRAQIIEGLVMSEQLKAAVADKYASDDAWPGSLADLGGPPSLSGPHVAAVAVDQGTISIKYGNRANALIAGHVLSLRPTVTDSGAVVWTCGYAASRGSDPAAGAAAPNLTDVGADHLPASCR